MLLPETTSLGLNETVPVKHYINSGCYQVLEIPCKIEDQRHDTNKLHLSFPMTKTHRAIWLCETCFFPGTAPAYLRRL